MPLDEMEGIYDQLIPDIFQRKGRLIKGPLSLASNQAAYYDHEHWELVLDRLLQNRTMLDCHGNSSANPVVMCLATLMTSPASLFMCRSAHPMYHTHIYIHF